MAAFHRLSATAVYVLLISLSLSLSSFSVSGQSTGRKLQQVSPSPPPPPPSPPSGASSTQGTPATPASPQYSSDTGLGGITPAQVPGADFPADVVTCGILQSSQSGDSANSTSASDGVNRLYARGGTNNNSKSPVAGTLASTISCAVLTPGPSGQNGAPGLAATIEAAAARTNSAASLQPFIVAYAYTYGNGSPSLKGYLKTALDAILSANGCPPVLRLLTGAYTTAQADSTVASYTQGVSDTFTPDASVAQCFSGYGALSSAAAVAGTLQAAATASS